MTEVMQPPCCKDATMRIAMTQRTIFDSSTLRSTLSAFICVSMIFKSGFSGYIVNRSLNANREQYADPNIGGPWCVRTSHVTTILIFMCLYIQIYKDNKITFPHFVFSFQFLFFFLSCRRSLCRNIRSFFVRSCSLQQRQKHVSLYLEQRPQ